MIQLLGCFELDKFQGFDTEEDLVASSLIRVENSTLWGGKITANEGKCSRAVRTLV